MGAEATNMDFVTKHMEAHKENKASLPKDCSAFLSL